MAAPLTWFPTSGLVQIAKPILNVQYNIGYGFQSGSLDPKYNPIRFDQDNVSSGTFPLGGFDTLQAALDACQADFDQLPTSK